MADERDAAQQKSKAQRVKEEWAANAEEVRPGTFVFRCPLYTVAVHGPSSTVLVGGGGGRTKSGIPNGFKLFHWEAEQQRMREIGHCDTGVLLVASAALHPSERLAACSTEGECRLYRWSEEKGGKVSVEEAAKVRTEEGENSDQKAVTFSPSGELLATAGEAGVVQIWQVEKLLAGTAKKAYACIEFGTAVNCLSFSTDGTLLLATGLAGKAAVYQVEGAKLLRSLTPAKCSPPKAFMRGGCFVGANALVGQGKPRAGSHVVAWPVAEEAEPTHSARLPGPHHHTAFAALSREEGESALVACAMGEGDLAVVQSGASGSGQVMYRPAVHSFVAPGLAFAPAGTAVISVSLDRTCVVTPVRKDKRVAVVVMVVALVMLLVVLALLGYA